MANMTQRRPGWNQVWYPRHAHNGFLNLTLELGLPGLLVLCCGLLRTLRVNSRRPPRELGTQWCFLYVSILTVLYNLVETTLATPNNLLWCLYVATSFDASRLRVVPTAVKLPAGLTLARVAGSAVIVGAVSLWAVRFFDVQLWYLAQARNDEGRYLLRQERYDAAIDVLERASTLRPDWHVPHVNLGLAHKGLEHEALANYHLDRAVQLDHESGEALAYRGRYFLAKRRFDDARRDLEQSLARGSSSLEHFEGLATAHAGLGSPDLALSYTRMFVQAGGDLGSHIVTISAPFFEDPANLAAGVEYFTLLEREVPGQWWIPYNIGTLADRLGQPARAREARARAELLRAADDPDR
jgi:tetratricopeptide (TPR) repeat protein